MYASWSLSIKKAYLQGTFSNPKMYNITSNSSHDEQVTGFLRFIQDQDIGVDLYEGNADTFGEWKKLNLTENNGTFGFNESAPCNN